MRLGGSLPFKSSFKCSNGLQMLCVAATVNGSTTSCEYDASNHGCDCSTFPRCAYKQERAEGWLDGHVSSRNCSRICMAHSRATYRGFGSQMPNTPMVIMWMNNDGTATISQRQARAEVMPTVDSNPPRTATLATNLLVVSRPCCILRARLIIPYHSSQPPTQHLRSTCQSVHLDSFEDPTNMKVSEQY